MSILIDHTVARYYIDFVCIGARYCKVMCSNPNVHDQPIGILEQDALTPGQKVFIRQKVSIKYEQRWVLHCIVFGMFTCACLRLVLLPQTFVEACRTVWWM